jgi:hypothetical protein
VECSAQDFSAQEETSEPGARSPAGLKETRLIAGGREDMAGCGSFDSGVRFAAWLEEPFNRPFDGEEGFCSNLKLLIKEEEDLFASIGPFLTKMSFGTKISSNIDMAMTKTIETMTKKNVEGLSWTRNKRGIPTAKICKIHAIAIPMYLLSLSSSDICLALYAWKLAKNTAPPLTTTKRLIKDVIAVPPY